ncbi:protein PAM71, chloroplastic isoform X2 [Rutidosis leptorrhynchoides]|uniref:protein PAM71, chloroplastic isoform X2 n=1 Tax=Rutidosis leptorrhynchoides TaxID=125765 RepID=UPI003A99F8A7
MRSMTTLCSSSDSSLLLMRTKINSFSSHNTFHSRVFSRQHFVKLNNKLGLRQFQHSRSHFNVLHSDGDNAIKLTRNSENWECSTSENYLKFMLFFGIFAFQDAQNALAGSDVASLVQSNSFFGDFSDLSTGFASAFLLIFFSELGDKTFFIAALLAARNSAAVVFMGTFGALGIMTIISVVLGRTFHYVDEVLPFRFGDTDIPIDDIAAALLLVYFGVSTLLDASSGDGLKAEEEQKEAEIAVSEVLGNGAGILAAASTVISTFLLVFVAEWGDKSFFSTIALAAASSPLGVIGGALAGHGLATLLAVLGGSLLGTFLSEKVIAYVGGVLFLVFAAVTLVEIVT